RRPDGPVRGAASAARRSAGEGDGHRPRPLRGGRGAARPAAGPGAGGARPHRLRQHRPPGRVTLRCAPLRGKNLRFLPRTYLHLPPRQVPNAWITDSSGPAKPALTTTPEVY